MIAKFKVSVVTLCAPSCVIKQKVYVNEPDDAEICAQRWQTGYEELITKLGYTVRVKHIEIWS